MVHGRNGTGEGGREEGRVLPQEVELEGKTESKHLFGRCRKHQRESKGTLRTSPREMQEQTQNYLACQAGTLLYHLRPRRGSCGHQLTTPCHLDLPVAQVLWPSKVLEGAFLPGLQELLSGATQLRIVGHDQRLWGEGWAGWSSRLW